MDETYIETTIDEILNLKKNNCSWSKSGNYLAITTTNQDDKDKIYFFDLENQILNIENSNDDNDKILAFKWNNFFSILACLWNNQSVEIFVIKDESKKVVSYNFKEENFENFEQIIKFSWFNEGNSFFFVTNNGIIKFYNLDSLEMKLNLIKVLNLNDSIIKTKNVYQNENLFVYLLTKTGSIYCIDEKDKNISLVLETNLNFIKLLFFKKKTILVLITKDLDLYQYNFSDNNFIETKKIKLEIFGNIFSKSNKVNIDLEKKLNQKNFVVKLDDNQGLIGLSIVGERIIRIIQIQTGYNEAMINIDSIDNQWSGLSFLKFNKKQKILVSGTLDNQLIIFKMDFNINDKNIKTFDFTKLFQINFQKSINKISISPKEKISIIINNLNIHIIEKQILKLCFMKNLIIKQVDSKELELIWIDDNEKLNILFEENIKNIYIDSTLKTIGVQSNKTKEIILIKLKNRNEYEIINKIYLGNFKIILHQNKLWFINIEMNKIENLSNLSLNYFNYKENQEQKNFPINLKKFINKNKLSLQFIDLNNNFLLLIFKIDTFKLNYIYTVYELNEDQAQIKFKPTLITLDEIILNSKINSNSSFIALNSSNSLFFIDLDKNNIEKVKLNFSSINNLYFDYIEPRLICIEDKNYYFVLICYKQKLMNQKSRKSINYFVYERKKIEKNNFVIGFQVPDIHILKKDENLKNLIVKDTLIEFNEISFDIIKLLIDFLTDVNPNLNLMIKNISKKNEKNENLWLNLARISVKCSNIEMGLFCMSKLKNVRIIQDVQNELKSKNFVNNEIDKKYTALAILAFNLNLFEEAEKFFLLSNNKSKLVKFYECCNNWDKAILTTDNLSKRTTYYNYAKYFEEELNDLNNSIKYYELSNTFNFEVPRLLFDSNKIDLLRNYCLENKLDENIKKNSIDLKQWWGHYCESIGDFNSSIESYKLANDYYNQVRLLCSIGNLDEAKKVLDLDKSLEKSYINEKEIENNLELKSKKSALLHLAKQLETIDPNFSVQCFLNCGAINYAIKTCKINNMNKNLVNIIQNFGSENEVIELLNTIEENEENYETIFNLYKKIHLYDKSIKIGLKGYLWQQLRSLTKVLLIEDNELKIENNSKVLIEDETIELALELLKNNSQIIDIVLNILLIKGNNENLIKDLILDYKIQVNEELIDKVENIFGNKKNQSVNSGILFNFLAESALMQGKYIIAAKLFNFNNDRLNAVKALIRSNDINKVINYANIARNKEVFKIAANFLQKSEGNEKTVELFLKKAGRT